MSKLDELIEEIEAMSFFKAETENKIRRLVAVVKRQRLFVQYYRRGDGIDKASANDCIKDCERLAGGEGKDYDDRIAELEDLLENAKISIDGLLVLDRFAGHLDRDQAINFGHETSRAIEAVLRKEK